MTTTVIINAVTVGNGASPTLTNVTKTSLQAATTAYSIGIKLVNGALAGNLNEYIYVYVCTTPFTPTAGLAAAVSLARLAVRIDVRPAVDPSGEIYYASPLLPRLGDNNYIWVEEGTLRTPATLTVDLVEIP